MKLLGLRQCTPSIQMMEMGFEVNIIMHISVWGHNSLDNSVLYYNV